MTRLSDVLADVLDERLAEADRELQQRYPGPGTRQPVHTVYIPADRFSADAHRQWGAAAVELLDRHAPSTEVLADATGMPVELVGDVHDRVRAKLGREPIEDLRVDFEDGYGQRSDEEEDRAAGEGATALAAVARAEDGPPFLGIRFKSFEAPTRRRGLRTLDLVVGGLLASGALPEGFVVTLPKVTSVAQVEAMVEVCARLEQAHALPAGRLRFEIQVETPQAILAADGTATVARMIAAADGRCTGLHYGTYDYSAALGVTAASQSLEHPAADHAKAVMQVAAAGTGVHLSDGSTNVLPTGDQDAVHAAWRLHARLVTRSLERGYYQGWDMHPGHLPTRYLATYSFFRASLPATAARIRAYLGRVEGGVMDEPATAQALAAAVLRGVDCGAVTLEEASELTGVDRARLQGLARRTHA
ncbi:Citrate lyase beta subunit [Geodermatophilus obscurus]|uniref:Citrate lyase beta subunit n=1 Tax=Geodermatophilus obscurus TaxID=1861 RepID=A0A1M7USM4_9ACTN|nr:aldolase/citrate lyase family protein [Geodermatophilus obscurus]SHN85959.1 Citrate lyase beta subunit [Geodermatophilus obscurus]